MRDMEGDTLRANSAMRAIAGKGRVPIALWLLFLLAGAGAASRGAEPVSARASPTAARAATAKATPILTAKATAVTGSVTAKPTSVLAPRVTASPAPSPTPRPTPVPPRREPERRKGGPPKPRAVRFASPHVIYSLLRRVEEVDLDRDGVFESLVDGVGTVRRLPPGIPTLGVVSKSRLPFESPLLTVFQRRGTEWVALFLAHVPLSCGQAEDLDRCDQLMAFHSVRFRFDDRPQVLVQILYSGEGGFNETRTYRSVGGKLEPTFSVSLPREAVEVEVAPTGIRRRVAVDTFVNQNLPPRYRSFTLASGYLFGERRFRVHSEKIEEEWSERGDLDLTYWGLVHQPSFAADLELLREKNRRSAAEGAGAFDPLEVVRKRYPDATEVRIGSKQPGLAIVYFQRLGCYARAVVYQPLREWEGEKTFWEMALIRGGSDVPYECLEEPPVEVPR